MIRAVIQDNEESVGPLADGEVARLLSVLQNAEFTRSDKHDLAKNRSFRQRSLIEIATEAKQRKDTTETAQQNLDSVVEPNSVQVENFLEAQSDSLNKKNSAIAENEEKAPEQTIRGITSKQTMDVEATEPETGVRGLTTNSILSSDTYEQEQGIRGLTSVPHVEGKASEEMQELRDLTSSSSGHDEQTAKNSFETANAAFERGKAEGISEGRSAAIAETKEGALADAKAGLADIVDSFHNALNSLARPKAMQAGALSSSIHAAIVKLASERAGMQIDDMPKAFSDRINALVTSIGQELADGVVQLNEDDYATMKPYLANLDFQIVGNSDLMRGDVVLQFDGVELHDVASNRMANHSAEKLTNVAVPAADNNIAADNDPADNDADPSNMLTNDELNSPPDETGS